MILSEAELNSLKLFRKLALEEDLNGVGDLTSQATIPRELVGRAAFVARSDGIVAGLPAALSVFANFKPLTPEDDFQPLSEDGVHVRPGDQLAIMTGSLWTVLLVERTALNFLQHLSGIATLTRKYVDAIAGTHAEIFDTRKTTPGWRLLEKYAVRCGGGKNHRVGLFDGILIKDNHLAALGGGRAAIRKAVELSRAAAPEGVFVEVEVDDLDQLEAALESRPDIVLLDNMSLDMLRQAVGRRNAAAPMVQLEASGGVTLDTVRAIAETGVDRISVGALTHSAPALDIGLDYLPG